MAVVYDIKEFRQKKRKEYMRKHAWRLERFVSSFVRSHMCLGFGDLVERYQSELLASLEASWDYTDFREILQDAISHAFRGELTQELRKFHWYDHRFISVDQVIDLCISAYVMAQTRAESGQQ